MIQLAFMASNKEIIEFTIDNRIVKEFDKMWPHGIQLLPLNKSLVKTLADSRSANLRRLADLIAEANTGKNAEEYDSCKTDEDIANMIRKDAKSKGLIEVK